MKINKRNAPPSNEFSSKTSDTYKLKSDSLDQLYREQLIELRDLILKKNAEPNDIEICRKWIKVFNQSTEAEKLARNCLCTLMQEQIKENSCLQKPFTDIQNCNRNLECILCELDEQATSYLHNQSFSTESENTLHSHGFISNQHHDLSKILQENQYVQLQSEISKLTHELQSLRLQLGEKEIETNKLKEITTKYRIEKETLEEILDNTKKSILENIKGILLEMEQKNLKTKLTFFQHIFEQFSNDKDFVDVLRKYDLDLQNVLHKQFKLEFDDRKSLIARHICRKLYKSKQKLRVKYQYRLAMQTESHKLQLKLAKLNSFSILRQIFINYHNEFGKLEGWEILKVLEDKYQNIVNSDLS